MAFKFKIVLLLPILFSITGCSQNKEITFKCGSFTFKTYYEDAYFLRDNEVVDEDIALASHAMALTTFSFDEDYTKRSLDVRELWEKENFGNIYFNQSCYERPGIDTIGYGIASKKIALDDNPFTLLAIAVRGGNYEGEWVSNITIGAEGNATGFDEASDELVKGISEYISKYEIEGKVKFWISGYSRAAITSNMTAGKIINRLRDQDKLTKDIEYTTDDIYAYCFEPPMGVQITLDQAHSSEYKGIHNFLNYNDIVPLVAPYEWGFVRYGTDHYYPDRLNDINFDRTEREKLISLYHFTYGSQNFAKYSVDDWKFFDPGEKFAAPANLPRESVFPSQGRFVRAFIGELALRGIKNRANYAYSIEDGLRDLMRIVLGYDYDIKGIPTESLLQIILEYDFIKSLIHELEEDQVAQFAIDVEMLFLKLFGATDESLPYLRNLYDRLFPLFVYFGESFSVRKDVLHQLFYRDNAMGLLIGHMPEVSYTFLSACNSHFYGNRVCKFNDGSYKIMRVRAPKTFILEEKKQNRVIFSFENDEMRSECISAERLADGTLQLYLPNNGDYVYESDCDMIEVSLLDPLKGEIPLNSTFDKSGNL